MTKLVGIDLGTTFSAIAMLNSIGRPEIIPNCEGERITASAVYFDEEEGGVRVGIEAINSRQLNTNRAVRFVKRYMGTDWTKTIDNHNWTPQEISSLILKKLKQDAEKEHGAISDVVISVPAHFDETRRKATMDAGTLAGLNVIGIVNEPVAAALFYAASHDITGRVLVYDLGGGTFDVTILDIKGKDMKILCSQGDHALGGIDFDHKIIELFEQEYQKQCNAKLIQNDQDMAKFEDEAEDVKKTLSRRNNAKKILYGSNGSARAEITRDQFEKAIESLIARTEMLIDVALDEAKSTTKDINKILLVGGSTRMPMVQERLTKKFGFAPEAAVNVDECVALGAAVHAGLTMLREKPESVPQGIAGGLRDVRLKDVCNHSYGTICAPVDEQTGRHVVRNTILLKKNTSLPCSTTQTFYTMADNQTELQIMITQGEDEDPDFVNKIATEIFELPAGRSAGRPIRVEYSYDANQRMHCEFEDQESGRKLEVEFCIGKDGELSQNHVHQQAETLQKMKVQ
ncbi:MAG: Hsp70 family protein [Anaerohalosphaeraceae bacterium]